jgi:S1-C subfamily serine protease
MMKKLMCIFVLAVLAVSCLSQELKSEEIYKKVLPSVMTVSVEDRDGKLFMGTAFLIVRDGLAATAWHVVRNAKRVSVKFSDGEEFESSGIVDKDEKRDLAVIRIKTFGRPMLNMSTSDPSVGTKTYIVGAPKGLEFSITEGLLSQIQTIDGVKQYQFSCAASSGNSGGPLVNSKGEAIGVVSWQFKEGQNLNFAVPIGYLLGLDLSLSTKSWEEVKASEPPLGKVDTISNDEFDKLAANCWVTLLDMNSSVNITHEQVMKKPNGFKNGVPYHVYGLQNEANIEFKALNKPPNDPKREAIRIRFIEELTTMNKVYDLLIEAIQTAGKAGGWNPEANDLLAKSGGAYSSRLSIESKDIKTMLDSSVFKGNLPEHTLELLQNNKDASGFRLGVGTWQRNRVGITIVPKESFGYKLGLRIGDQIVSCEGKPLKSLLELKMIIKDSLDKRIKVVVMRDGKEKELKMKIPKELPKE